jgi:hypothetical protein
MKKNDSAKWFITPKKIKKCKESVYLIKEAKEAGVNHHIVNSMESYLEKKGKLTVKQMYYLSSLIDKQRSLNHPRFEDDWLAYWEYDYWGTIDDIF